MNGSRFWIVVAVCALAGTTLLAHDPFAPPVVSVTVWPRAGQLDVSLRVPLTALADANLPVDPSGRISPDDARDTLAIVARQLVSDLDFSNDGRPLPHPATIETLSQDSTYADIELHYSGGDFGQLSARFHAFRANTDRVATRVTYVAADGSQRSFVVDGDPRRVSFEPPAADVVREFARRGIDVVLGDGLFLILAACAAVVVRGAGRSLTEFASLAAGELAGFVLATLNALGPAGDPIARAIAASSVAVLALYLTLNSTRTLSPLLCTVFGATNGVIAGILFQRVSAFGGSHDAVASAVFFAVVVLGQLWIAALLQSAAGLLFRWGLPERATTLAVAIVVAHSALHRTADAAQLAATVGAMTADRFLTLLALAWALGIVAVGIARTLLGRPADAVAPFAVTARP